jgi:hypothetical protein
MRTQKRYRNMWPPRAASQVVLWLCPYEKRYSDYRDYLEAYRGKVTLSSTRRACRYAYWRARDDAWRAVPDYVKHGLMAIIVKLLPWGN